MSRAWNTAVVVALVAAAFVASPVATPADAASACESGDGVWVIVDPGTLGGSATTACAPGDPSSGTAALTSAGFSWEFVKSFPGLICRIGGKPGKDQETCEQAPPGDAYWAYWHADAGGTWTYARTGAAQRDPKPGQVEGWVFGTGSPPSVAPPAAPPEPEPQPQPEPEPGSGGSPSSGSSSGSGGSSGGSSPSSGGSEAASGSGGSSSPSSSGGSDGPSTSSSSGTAGSAGDADTDAATGAGSTTSDGDGDAVAGDVDAESDDGAVRSVDRIAGEIPGDDIEVDSRGLTQPVSETAEPLGTDGPARSGDEVAMDEVAASGNSMGGIIAAGLLAAIAALGAVVRRRRVET